MNEKADEMRKDTRKRATGKQLREQQGDERDTRDEKAKRAEQQSAGELWRSSNCES